LKQFLLAIASVQGWWKWMRAAGRSDGYSLYPAPWSGHSPATPHDFLCIYIHLGGRFADEESGFEPLPGVAPGTRLNSQQFEQIVRSPRYMSNFTALSWMAYRDFAVDSGEGRPWKAAVLPFDASTDAVKQSEEVLVSVRGEIVDITNEGQFKGTQQAGQLPSDAQVLVAYNVRLVFPQPYHACWQRENSRTRSELIAAACIASLKEHATTCPLCVY
jgi:hypothetical protein